MDIEGNVDTGHEFCGNVYGRPESSSNSIFDNAFFNDWFEKNPVLGVISLMGRVVAFAVLLYISQRLDEWESKRHFKKGKR